MQSSKRDTDLKNRLLDSVGGEGWLERIAVKHVYYICKIDDQCKFDAWSRAPKASALGQPRRIGLGGGSGWGYTYIPMIDSYWCTAKAITVL